MQGFSLEEFRSEAVLCDFRERFKDGDLEKEYHFRYRDEEVVMRKLKNEHEEYFESPYGSYYQFGKKGRIESEDGLRELSALLDTYTS